MPNDIAMLADAFLSRITEDETGIWELAQELPEISPGPRLSIARSALALLLAKQLVVATRGPAFGNGDRLDATEATAAISVQDSWGSPALTQQPTTLMLHATEAGESFYFSGAKLAETEPA